MSTPTSGQTPGVRRGRPPSGGREATLAAALEVLTERGASRLTTREVAQRAGVSEGSVFYHFADRTGLLSAVIEDGVKSLGALSERGIVADDVEQGIIQFVQGVESFLGTALVVMIAAQSDVELRTGLAAQMEARDMGPHRGIQVLADFLRAQQADGRVRPDVDLEAVAALVYGSCFQRVAQRLMVPTSQRELMPTANVVAATISHLLVWP